MSLKSNLLFHVLSLVPFLGFSQFKVEGQVKDFNHNNIEMSEIILTDVSTLVQNFDVTDKNGRFWFNIKNGNYLLEIRIMGKILFSKNIEVKSDMQLGEFLVDNSTNLDEIVIETKKKLYEKKVDRLIFNVEQSVAASGGNALDVFKLTPRIKVQNEEISMIGKDKMLVMINNRMIQLSGDDLAEYLKSINADDIKKIEVIANPPAMYNADGNSGLINIVTKNANNDYWNSSIRSIYQQATYPKGSFGGSFNFKKDDLQTTSSFTYTNGSNAPTASNNIFYPTVTWKETNKRRDFTDAIAIRLGLDYSLNKYISTGISYNYIDTSPLMRETNIINAYNLPVNNLDSIIRTKGLSVINKNIHTLNYHFIYELDSIGKKMSVDFDFFDLSSKTDRTFNTKSFNSTQQIIPSNQIEARNYGIQDIENYSVNVNMDHPSRWCNLNYGGKISIISNNNQFHYFDVENLVETINNDRSNEFNYKERTQALYVSAQKDISEKWESKFGLRLENTNRKGYSPTMNQTNSNSYTALFPTAYLAFNPNENNAFSLNYGKRINRPNYSFLNPFRWVSSPYSYSEGNPLLQHSFVHNIELGYAYKDNLITNIYFSYSNNDFEQVTIIDADSNIQRVVPMNFLTNKKLGINQSILVNPYKWLVTNFSADIFYTSTNSKIPITLQYLKGWNGIFSLSNDITLDRKKSLLLNFSYSYISRGVDNLDYSSAGNQLDTSLKWLGLQKRLIISLIANDILSSNRYTYTTYTNGIKNSFRNYYDERYVRLSIVYNLGKEINTERRDNKNQEEYNRTN